MLERACSSATLLRNCISLLRAFVPRLRATAIQCDGHIGRLRNEPVVVVQRLQNRFHCGDDFAIKYHLIANEPAEGARHDFLDGLDRAIASPPARGLTLPMAAILACAASRA